MKSTPTNEVGLDGRLTVSTNETRPTAAPETGRA